MAFQAEHPSSFQPEPALHAPEGESDRGEGVEARPSEYWQAFYDVMGEEAARDFDWKAETGTIQTYEHRETLRFLHIDGLTGQCLNQQAFVISKAEALAHVMPRVISAVPEFITDTEVHVSEAADLNRSAGSDDVESWPDQEAAGDHRAISDVSSPSFEDSYSPTRAAEERPLRAAAAEDNGGALKSFIRTRATEPEPALPDATGAEAERSRGGVWSRLFGFARRNETHMPDDRSGQSGDERRLARTANASGHHEPDLNVFLRRSTQRER